MFSIIWLLAEHAAALWNSLTPNELELEPIKPPLALLLLLLLFPFVSACDELIKWLCGEIREPPLLLPFSAAFVLISSGIRLRAELKSMSGMGSECSRFVLPLVDELEEDGGVEAAEESKWCEPPDPHDSDKRLPISRSWPIKLSKLLVLAAAASRGDTNWMRWSLVRRTR
jgi:hypothetical protein